MLQNLDPGQGLCNRTRLYTRPDVQIITGLLLERLSGNFLPVFFPSLLLSFLCYFLPFPYDSLSFP